MSIDPSHYLSAANGGRPPLLKLQNIAAKPELNGQFGQAVSFSSGRYVVALLDVAAAAGQQQQPTYVKLKPENLAESGHLDQFKFGVRMLIATARAKVASPAVQEWGKRLVDAVPPAVRSPRLTPDRALLAAAVAALALVLVAGLLLGRVVGHDKLAVLASLGAVAAAVSFPDWGAGPRRAAANFPRRWREHIATLPGCARVSDRVALASLVALAAWSGKLLLTPAGPPRPPPPPPGVPPGGLGGGGGGAPPRVPGPQYDLEHIYKLGFDDAGAGREFGTSLPEDVLRHNAAREASLPPPDAPYRDASEDDWVPPPRPAKPRSSLGMGTLMSLVTLYRFGKDAVTAPDGTVVLEPRYVWARAKSMEPWRLAVLGFSLYRVATALGFFQ